MKNTRFILIWTIAEIVCVACAVASAVILPKSTILFLGAIALLVGILWGILACLARRFRSSGLAVSALMILLLPGLWIVPAAAPSQSTIKILFYGSCVFTSGLLIWFLIGRRENSVHDERSTS